MLNTLFYLILCPSILLASPLTQIEKDLDGILQKYEKVTGKDSDCTEDFPELVFESDEQNPTVHLGEKFVFPNVNLPATTEKSSDDCTFTSASKTTKLGLDSKIVHQCKSEKDSYEINQTLSYSSKILKLSYVKKSPNQVLSKAFDCSYKPMGKTKK